MIALPEIHPDCRDAQVAKVHADFSVRFDANTYTVPPTLIGKQEEKTPWPIAMRSRQNSTNCSSKP
jgi:hypothetical protein